MTASQSMVALVLERHNAPFTFTEVAVLSARHWECLHCQGVRCVPLGMSRTHPECLDSDPSDRSVAIDVLLRQGPDEEEEEDEGEGQKDDDDDDKDDDGYSE